MMIDDETLGSVDARMPTRTRVEIDAVEIDAHLIGPVVAARHSVRIEHGYELEDKLTSEDACARIVGPENELEKSVENKRRRRLARVHATREHKHALLVESKASFGVRLGKQTLGIEAWLATIRDLMIRADRDQVDASLVDRFGEQLAVVIDRVRITKIIT